ncbi:Uncharacterised protein [uncultured archaeon]|nr:Uncharacterised protein [uncultured archaeon]
MQDKNEMIREKTEMVSQRQYHKKERKDRFLSIFFWTD